MCDLVLRWPSNAYGRHCGTLLSRPDAFLRAHNTNITDLRTMDQMISLLSVSISIRIIIIHIVEPVNSAMQLLALIHDYFCNR